MEVRITERRCTVPAEVLERTRVRIGSLARYQPRASTAEVVFSEEKLATKVEVIVSIDGADPVLATGEASDFRSALDRVVDRLSRRLRRQRQRRRDHKAPPLGGE